MKRLLPIAGLLSALMLFSCSAVHKSGISPQSVPEEVSQGKCKVLFTEINFENTVSARVAKVNNSAAKKHVAKRTGDARLFIAESELDQPAFADRKVFRYVLINRITGQVHKTYYRQGPTGSRVNTGTSESPITEFYFVDRLTGKEYPHTKGTTMPLYMLKAIVDKVTPPQS